MTRARAASLAAASLLGGALLASPAWAQARNPFSVGISEGGGASVGIMGWILAQQASLERALSAAVRAGGAHSEALAWLAGLSFAYGVLHAAGPGHGKAVLASYMMADERALRRGVVMSILAALLQAAVAVALVGTLSLAFHATAIGMRDGAAIIEKASSVGVAALGLWLVARKGANFARAWRDRPRGELPFRPALASSGWGTTGRDAALARTMPDRFGGRAAARASFACSAIESAAHRHGPDCGHRHAPDPARLGDGFSWREAASTVVAAGARPCSGAILVLVFSLDRGVFLAGIGATLVMALGTAITTAALAATAVLAKGIAMRLVGRAAARGALLARGLELAAAVVVLTVGLSLMFGVGPLQALA